MKTGPDVLLGAVLPPRISKIAPNPKFKPENSAKVNHNRYRPIVVIIVILNNIVNPTKTHPVLATLYLNKEQDAASELL